MSLIIKSFEDYSKELDALFFLIQRVPAGLLRDELVSRFEETDKYKHAMFRSITQKIKTKVVDEDERI